MVVGKFNLVISIGSDAVIIHPPSIDKHLNISTFNHTLLYRNLTTNGKSVASLGNNE